LEPGSNGFCKIWGPVLKEQKKERIKERKELKKEKYFWDGTHLCSRPCMFRSEAVGTQPTDRPLPGNKPRTTSS
jgi:hypothetical protein